MLDVWSRWRQLRDQVPALRLYALVDGIEYGARLSRPLRDGGALPLFAGTADAPLADAGPWLIDASVARQAFIDELTALERDVPSVSWLIALQDPIGLAQLLQLRLDVTLPDGRRALLRFWDPRVLFDLARTLDGAQREEFFGHVHEPPAQARCHTGTAARRSLRPHERQGRRTRLMASLAKPLIEAAAARVLAALGGGLAGGAVADAAKERARKRLEASDKATSSPVARTDATTKTREKCKECPPDGGKPFERRFAVRRAWVDYQARVTGMPSGPTFIIEWNFNEVKFDGFVSADCLLQDAKGGYDGFFDEWGEVLDWWRHNVEEMMKEVSRQSLVAVPRPPVRLEWFWQQPMSYRYFSKVLGPVAPDVPHHFFP